MSKFNKDLNAGRLFKEYSNWHRDKPKLRFGQYIINKYLNEGETAPEIFYEEDQGKALDMIAKET
jgi:hypothetical protein